MSVIQRVEELADVHFHYPAAPRRHRPLPQRIQRLRKEKRTGLGQASFSLAWRQGRRGAFPGSATWPEGVFQVVTGRGDALPLDVAVWSVAIYRTPQCVQFGFGLWPMDDREPIRGQGQRPIRQPVKGLGAFKGLVGAILLKQRQARNGSVQNVIDVTSRRSTGNTSHGPMIRNA